MSKEKLRVHRTALDNLAGNLRGEIGEIVTSWTLLRQIMTAARQHQTDDIPRDLANQKLTVLHIHKEKLHDEIVARLSELAERKVGRLTFYFAGKKIGKFALEVEEFARFIRARGFEEKRNLDIAHKVLPEQWSEHRHRHVSYKDLVRAVALALRLMKMIDRELIGPASPYLWAEMRRKRYEPMAPPKAGYLLLPYLRLPELVRAKIIFQEQAEGRQIWENFQALINGQEGTVVACRRWGGVVVSGQLLILKDYPLQQIERIDIASQSESGTA